MADLFVYGTLLRGASNHHRLSGARFLAAAVTEPRYDLFDFGWHPALVDAGATAVRGEVYALPDDALPAIDAFEGEHEFVRREVRLAGGASAWAYFFIGSTAGHARIPDGDWLAWAARAR